MKTLNEYMELPYKMEIVEDKEDYSGQFKLRIPKSLHRLLAEHSKREGISMNQYCLYLLPRNDAVYYEVRGVVEKLEAVLGSVRQKNKKYS